MESLGRTEKCKEIFALLSEYLNLKLPPEACVEIQAHIAACPPCVEFAESLRKTVAVCRQYQPDGVPEPLGQEARERLLDAYRKMLASRQASH